MFFAVQLLNIRIHTHTHKPIQGHTHTWKNQVLRRTRLPACHAPWCWCSKCCILAACVAESHFWPFSHSGRSIVRPHQLYPWMGTFLFHQRSGTSLYTLTAFQDLPKGTRWEIKKKKKWVQELLNLNEFRISFPGWNLMEKWPSQHLTVR